MASRLGDQVITGHGAPPPVDRRLLRNSPQAFNRHLVLPAMVHAGSARAAVHKLSRSLAAQGGASPTLRPIRSDSRLLSLSMVRVCCSADRVRDRRLRATNRLAVVTQAGQRSLRAYQPHRHPHSRFQGVRSRMRLIPWKPPPPDDHSCFVIRRVGAGAALQPSRSHLRSSRVRLHSAPRRSDHARCS